MDIENRLVKLEAPKPCYLSIQFCDKVTLKYPFSTAPQSLRFAQRWVFFQ